MHSPEGAEKGKVESRSKNVSVTRCVQCNFSCCQATSSQIPLACGTKLSSVGLLGEVPGEGVDSMTNRELLLAYRVIYVMESCAYHLI